MNEAIWQFRLFERASLDYLRLDRVAGGAPQRVRVTFRSGAWTELARTSWGSAKGNSVTRASVTGPSSRAASRAHTHRSAPA